jgi:hypothetical protein
MKEVTIIVTSCDRFDLLERTLDSFFTLNKYPYHEIIINNDSLHPFPTKLYNKYVGMGVTWHYGIKRGLSGSFDFLVSKVNTEYFFNIEDDWLFDGNPNFISESIEILENTFFEQVWIRHESDLPYKLDANIEQVKGLKYKRVPLNGDWCGFSFNPAVRNLARWKSIFPNGVNGIDEIDLSRRVFNFYSACSLVNTSIRHIGYNRHSKNFQI